MTTVAQPPPAANRRFFVTSASTDRRQGALDALREATGGDSDALNVLAAIEKKAGRKFVADEVTAYGAHLQAIYEASSSFASTSFQVLTEYVNRFRSGLSQEQLAAFAGVATSVGEPAHSAVFAICVFGVQQGRALTAAEISSYQPALARIGKFQAFSGSSACELLGRFAALDHRRPTIEEVSSYADAFTPVAKVAGNAAGHAFDALAEFARQAKRALTPSEVQSYEASFAAVTRATGGSLDQAYDLLAEFAKQFKRPLTPAEVSSYEASFAAVSKALTDAGFDFAYHAFETLIEFTKQEKRVLSPAEVLAYAAPFAVIAKAVGDDGYGAFGTLSQFAVQQKRALTLDEVLSYQTSFAAIGQVAGDGKTGLENRSGNAFKVVDEFAKVKGKLLTPAELKVMEQLFAKNEHGLTSPLLRWSVSVSDAWRVLEAHLETSFRGLNFTFEEKLGMFNEALNHARASETRHECNMAEAILRLRPEATAAK